MTEAWVECGEWEMVPVFGLDLQPRPGIPPGGKACVVCGKGFVPQNRRIKTCGKECSKEYEKEVKWKYSMSPEGKEVQQKAKQKYRASPEGKEAQQKVNASPKAKKAKRDYRRKKILIRGLIEASILMEQINEQHGKG